jgi:large subunit ribosomal protein L5
MGYDPEVGDFGMDITVVIDHPGTRIKHRMIKTSKVPRRHRVSRQEAKDFLKSRFNVEVVE